MHSHHRFRLSYRTISWDISYNPSTFRVVSEANQYSIFNGYVSIHLNFKHISVRIKAHYSAYNRRVSFKTGILLYADDIVLTAQVQGEIIKYAPEYSYLGAVKDIKTSGRKNLVERMKKMEIVWRFYMGLIGGFRGLAWTEN